MNGIPRTGAPRRVPVLFLAGLLLAGAGAPLPVRAAPSPAAPDSVRLATAATLVLDGIRRDPAYPPTLEAIQLLLLDYARTGDAARRTRARELARVMRDRNPELASPEAFYLVAQAGGEGLTEAEPLMAARRRLMDMASRATTDAYAGFARDLFVRAAAVKDPSALVDAFTFTGRLLDDRTEHRGNRVVVLPGGGAATAASLSDYTEVLRAASAAEEASGSASLRADLGLVARELIAGFWNDRDSRFDVPAVDRVDRPEEVVPLLNARAALALWEAGSLTGDAFLAGRARRALDSILREALRSPRSAPAAALAAARMSGDPVEMIVLGDPQDPAVTALRERCFFAFEPRKLVLNLNPVPDAGRLEALGLSGAAGPGVILRCGALRSPLVRDPEEVTPALGNLLSRTRGPLR